MEKIESKNTKNLVITIVVALVCLGVGFFGGFEYQKLRRNNQFQKFAQNGAALGNGTGRMMGTGRNGGGFQPVSGEIQSIDGTTITVKLTNGGSKIVVLSDKTTISKSSEASKTDLKVGEKITAFGTSGTDGTVTATNIQMNPLQMGNPNGGAVPVDSKP